MSHTVDGCPEGKWVRVVSGGSNVYTGGRTTEIGVLEARDDAFLYVRRADGEVAVIMAKEVQILQVIEPPAETE